MVELIQTDSAHKTLILSIKAGGVGLNLTGANHVIHYDLWWNPAVENQATDRAYRIGQDKNVFVHRLVCSNSFEEKINQMIKDKQELANLTVATGEQWVGNLSDKELGQLFKLN
jgi:SNF2 family DNA or RNA helicase